MTIKKKLVASMGKYTTADGSEKTRWLTVGHVHDGSKGEYITLESHINLAAIPRKDGDSRVYLNMFEPDEKKGGGKPAPAADDGTDVPF